MSHALIIGDGPAGRLLWKEGRDLRWVLLFVVLVDIAGILAAHAWFGLPVERIGAPGMHAWIVLACASTAPVVAELFSQDERTGAGALLRTLPLRASALASAKLLALAATLTFVSLLVVAMEQILHLGGAFHENDAQHLGELFGSLGDTRVAMGLTGLMLSSTAVIAYVSRNALAATLGGLVALAGLLALALTIKGMPDWALFILGLTTLGLGHPIGAIALPVLLSVLVGRRGPTTRSAWRRSSHLVAVVAGVAITGACAMTLREVLRAPPSFEEEGADVFQLYLTRDGKQAALSTRYRDGFTFRTAIWTLDTESWDIERLPAAIPPTRSWLPWTRISSLAGWSSDGRQVLGMIYDERGGGGDVTGFAIDPASGKVAASTYYEMIAQTEHGGVSIEPVLPSGFEKRITLRDGTEYVIGGHQISVPKQAADAVFYVDRDRVLRRVDLRSGEDTEVSVEMSSRSSYEISPDGRYLYLRDQGHQSRLIDLQTARSRPVEATLVAWTRRSHLLACRGPNGQSGWTLVAMDEEVSFEPERVVDRLYDVDGRYWLGTDSVKDAVYAFDADGSLIRTIREGRVR